MKHFIQNDRTWCPICGQWFSMYYFRVVHSRICRKDVP